MFFLLCFASSVVNERCRARAKEIPLRPENHTLKFIELVTRHGARTPNAEYLSLDRRGTWICDSEAAIATRFSAVPQMRPRRIHKIIDSRLATYPPNCQEGDLTVDGMLEHRDLGILFRKYLVDQQSFLPEDLDNGIMYLHATHSQRTYDSALSFMQGLYPPVSMNEILTIESGVSGKDYFHPERKSCKELKELSKNYTSTTEFKEYMKETANVIQPLLDALDVTDPDADDIDGVCDFTFTYWCNDNTFTPEVTDEMIEKCIEYQGKMMFGLYSSGKGIAASPSMRELFRLMDESLGGHSPVRFALISSHDSTVAALLTMLGYTEVQGPPYASYLAFEVWENEDSKEFYIRVFYNGKEIPLIDGNTLVKLHEFRALVGPLTSHCHEFL